MSNDPVHEYEVMRRWQKVVAVIMAVVALGMVDLWSLHPRAKGVESNNQVAGLSADAHKTVETWVTALAQGNLSGAEALSAGGEMAVLQENATQKTGRANLAGLSITPVSASRDAAIAEVSAQTVTAGIYDESNYRLYLLRTGGEWRVYGVQPVPFSSGVGTTPKEAPTQTVAAYLAAVTQDPSGASQYLAGEALQASGRDPQLAGQVAGVLKIQGVQLKNDGTDGDVAWVRGRWQAQIGKQVRPVTAEFILQAIAGVWRIERVDVL